MDHGTPQYQTAAIETITAQLQTFLQSDDGLTQLIPEMPCALAYVQLMETYIACGRTITVGTDLGHDRSIIDAAWEERRHRWQHVDTSHDIDVQFLVDQFFDGLEGGTLSAITNLED